MPQIKHLPLILAVIVIAAINFLPDAYGRFVFERGVIHWIFALAGLYYAFNCFQAMQRKEKYALIALAFSLCLTALGVANAFDVFNLSFMHALLGYIFIMAIIYLL